MVTGDNWNSSLEELIDRTTIKFPVPLDFSEFKEEFFNYLFEKKKYTFHYNVSLYGHCFLEDNGKLKAYEAIDNLNLDITKIEGIVRSYSFNVKTNNEKQILSLSLNITPGYESIEEYEEHYPSGKAQIEFVDNLRGVIGKYFS